MPSPHTLLGGLSPKEFLNEYWQKKPLLIRNAFPGFQSPISPEELAGLSLEDEAESRLIIEEGGDYPWQLRHGPLEEEDFASLPETNWTLLVQEVDQWVPEVAELLEPFDFIPKWRIDDIMVSYAPDRGNVGAHIDNYDVFLLQGAGKREWRIRTTPTADEHLVQGVDVSMLADFEPDAAWTLEAGDMLYLPPRISHHGIAVGDCMTFSIGFRAPSHREMLAGILGRAIEEVDPSERYSDPDLKPQDEDGLISEDALRRVRTVLNNVLTDENVARWFGALVTESKRSEFILPSETEWDEKKLKTRIESGGRLDRVEPNRFAYAVSDAEAILFVHGEEVDLDRRVAFAAPLLAGNEALDDTRLSRHLENDAFVSVLTRLVNSGHLLILDEK